MSTTVSPRDRENRWLRRGSGPRLCRMPRRSRRVDELGWIRPREWGGPATWRQPCATRTGCRRLNHVARGRLRRNFEPRREPGRWLATSPLLAQCLRRLNAKRPSRRDDAGECTAENRRQREERGIAQYI